MQGWIKLHRCLMDKPIWIESTPEQKTILITLLMMANHKGKEWEWMGEKYKAKPGQFVTSLESIVKKSGVGISVQNVRTSLKRFEKYEFLTNQSTNKNRLITIVNWEIYQSSDEGLTSNLTGSQQATNKQLTTNKNVKNDKKKEYTPQFENWWSEYPRKTDKKDAFKAYQKAIKNHSIEVLLEGAKGYAKKVKQKNIAEEYIKHGATFLNKESFKDYLPKQESKRPSVVSHIDPVLLGKLKRLDEIMDMMNLTDDDKEFKRLETEWNRLKREVS